MNDIQLLHYKYYEESKEFKKLNTDNDSIHCIRELIYIVEYLKNNSIEHKIDENENIQLL